MTVTIQYRIINHIHGIAICGQFIGSLTLDRQGWRQFGMQECGLSIVHQIERCVSSKANKTSMFITYEEAGLTCTYNLSILGQL